MREEGINTCEVHTEFVFQRDNSFTGDEPRIRHDGAAKLSSFWDEGFVVPHIRNHACSAGSSDGYVLQYIFRAMLTLSSCVSRKIQTPVDPAQTDLNSAPSGFGFREAM